MTGRIVSHYKIAEPLGSGGMGIVYRAEDVRLGRSVAIKFLKNGAIADAASLERFHREARTASSLNHPHICTVHDIGRHNGEPFLVMELLNGRTLAEAIGTRPLPFDTVLDFAIQITGAPDAAHAQGIVHRDIKPANVFVTAGNQVKILDFGLAKAAAAARQPMASVAQTETVGQDSFTSPGTTVGTI